MRESFDCMDFQRMDKNDERIFKKSYFCPKNERKLWVWNNMWLSKR